MTSPFLRVPPFPRHRARPVAVPTANVGGEPAGSARASAAAVADALRRCRVGAEFWLGPTVFPPGRDVLVCASAPERLAGVMRLAAAAGLAERVVVRSGGDPWSSCAAAAVVVADGDDEWALVAALIGRHLLIAGAGRFAALASDEHGAPAAAPALYDVVQTELVDPWRYFDPFDGQPVALVELIETMGRWRCMIESNRKFAAIYGVAPWKRVTADALLWDGTGPVRHAVAGGGGQVHAGATVLAWLSRTDAAAMAKLADGGVRLGEIEDGMIRSNGLGANCVPPMSIVVDSEGPHFDPAQPSELELILQTADIDAALQDRARRLRATIVARGIGKYGQGECRQGEAAPACGTRAAAGDGPGRVVVVTGQVEDDRSILCGGAGLDNLTLLRRARALEPGAWIIFKPHPDVEAGHRKGHVPDASALEFADEVDRQSSISALLARAQAVHVITSLAGFEALLRGCEVVTHGVPFYAGWGLTRDVGPVPARRSRRRTLDELVAATLILYPRYLDPVSRLPCEPELLVARIADGRAAVRTWRILFREVLGRARRWLRRG